MSSHGPAEPARGDIIEPERYADHSSEYKSVKRLVEEFGFTYWGEVHDWCDLRWPEGTWCPICRVTNDPAWYSSKVAHLADVHGAFSDPTTFSILMELGNPHGAW